MMRIGKIKGGTYMTACKLCQEFHEKYPLQKIVDPYNEWVHIIEGGIELAPTECAFQDNVFDSNNWNCLTIEKLRDLADYTDRNANLSIGVIRIPEQEGHIVMLWYKNRGRVSNAYVMQEDEEPTILTYDVVVSIIDGSR